MPMTSETATRAKISSTANVTTRIKTTMYQRYRSVRPKPADLSGAVGVSGSQIQVQACRHR